MKVKAVNRSNKNFIGIILIMFCLLGCEPKLLVVPDFPDKCDKQSDFSDTELFISQFKVFDLPNVYNYNAEDYIEMEEMFIEYIKNRNTFKEIHPSFRKKENPEGSFLSMDVEIIPDAAYETHYSCIDACFWVTSMGFMPAISNTTANIKITTAAQIRDSKGQMLKELKAEGLTSKSSNIYGYPGLSGEEEKARKIGELFEESYKKSFNLTSQYISEARAELVEKITPVDTEDLNDKQIVGEELDKQTGERNVESEARVGLLDSIIPVDSKKIDSKKISGEELDRKIGKRNGKRDAEKYFNKGLWIFNGVGTACISFGSGIIVELANYYSSGEEEIAGGTPYYYSYCIGMGLLGIIQSYMKNPAPPDPSVFVGKSPEYIESYTNEYRKASKESQTGAFALSYIITHGVGIMSLFVYSESSTTSE